VTKKLNSLKLHLKKLCYKETVDDRVILITSLNSVWKKKYMIKISFLVTKVVSTNGIFFFTVVFCGL
jgi:hypothetical protein